MSDSCARNNRPGAAWNLTHGGIALVEFVCDNEVIKTPLRSLHGRRQLPADSQQSALASRTHRGWGQEG